MHPQLQSIKDEYLSARDRLRRLASDLPDPLWTERPEPERWSAAECVAHLNVTSRTFLPVLRRGLAEAEQLGEAPPEHYRRDPAGWFLWKVMGPPVRIRVKTPAPFVPESTADRAEILRDFEQLQEEQIAVLEEADGLPLSRVKVPSPFSPRVKYNLFTCLSILPPHQHRHLWQAERAVEALRSAGGAPAASPHE